MKKQKTARPKTPGRVIGIRIAAIVLLLLVGAVMLVIGRGHTIYPENKTFEYEGKTYNAFYKVKIWDGAEEVAKLGKRDRGQVPCIGQSLDLVLDIERNQGDDVERVSVSLDIPYGEDNLLLNIPALVAELPQEVSLTKFAIAEEEPAEDEDEVPGGGDEFGIGGDI